MDFGSIFGKIGSAFHSLKDKISDNDTILLTGISCVGVVVTGVLAFKAGPVVKEAINQCDADIDDILQDGLTGEEARDMIKACRKERNGKIAKAVAGPVIAGTATIACDIFREKKWGDKFKDLAFLYALKQKEFDQFKDKTKEIVGQGKVDKIDDELAKDRVRERLYSDENHEVLNTGSGSMLFMSADTGQLFYASEQFISDAVNKFNAEVVRNGNIETPGDDLLYYLQLKTCKLIENMIFDSDHLADYRITSTREPVNGVMQTINILEIIGNKHPQWRDSLL